MKQLLLGTNMLVSNAQHFLPQKHVCWRGGTPPCIAIGIAPHMAVSIKATADSHTNTRKGLNSVYIRVSEKGMMTNLPSSEAISPIPPDTYLWDIITRTADTTQLYTNIEEEEVESSQSSENNPFIKSAKRIKHHIIKRLCNSCKWSWQSLSATLCLWFTYVFVSAAYSVIDPFFPSEVPLLVHGYIRIQNMIIYYRLKLKASHLVSLASSLAPHLFVLPFSLLLLAFW